MEFHQYSAHRAFRQQSHALNAHLVQPAAVPRAARSLSRFRTSSPLPRLCFQVAPMILQMNNICSSKNPMNNTIKLHWQRKAIETVHTSITNKTFEEVYKFI